MPSAIATGGGSAFAMVEKLPHFAAGKRTKLAGRGLIAINVRQSLRKVVIAFWLGSADHGGASGMEARVAEIGGLRCKAD